MKQTWRGRQERCARFAEDILQHQKARQWCPACQQGLATAPLVRHCKANAIGSALMLGNNQLRGHALRYKSLGRLTNPTSPYSYENAMRGLGYDARIERSVTSTRRTGLPPVSSPLCVECTLKLLKGDSTPRASSQVSGLYVFESVA